MNTRSKTKDLVKTAEICSKCYGEVDKTFYAAWCQANEVLCARCFIPDKCCSCNATIKVVRKVYVLDGMPECQPLCEKCLNEEMNS